MVGTEMCINVQNSIFNPFLKFWRTNIGLFQIYSNHVNFCWEMFGYDGSFIDH